jgi:hypothetical protein
LGQLGEQVHQGALKAIRRQLDEELLDQERIEGRGMSLDAALEYAVRCLD